MLIRINLTALRAAAERNQKVAQTVDETRVRINEMVARLDSAWDGGASGRAIDGLQELGRQAGKIWEGCEGTTQKLSGVADAFESVDSGVSILHALDTKIWSLVGCPNPFAEAILAVLGQLRIEPDEVRAVGAGCKEVADIYADTAADLRTMLGELLGEWEGRSAARFEEETYGLINAFIEMHDALTDYADNLFNAAERYEELDNMLAH